MSGDAGVSGLAEHHERADDRDDGHHQPGPKHKCCLLGPRVGVRGAQEHGGGFLQLALRRCIEVDRFEIAIVGRAVSLVAAGVVGSRLVSVVVGVSVEEAGVISAADDRCRRS